MTAVSRSGSSSRSAALSNEQNSELLLTFCGQNRWSEVHTRWATRTASPKASSSPAGSRRTWNHIGKIQCKWCCRCIGNISPALHSLGQRLQGVNNSFVYWLMNGPWLDTHSVLKMCKNEVATTSSCRRCSILSASVSGIPSRLHTRRRKLSRELNICARVCVCVQVCVCACWKLFSRHASASVVSNG